MILSTAMTGIDKNIPGMPQIISPITTHNTVIKALIRTFEATNQGQ
ncbi:MAG TPA: hypothetical protein VGN20_08430 [Mucilaginibacter sp.]